MEYAVILDREKAYGRTLARYFQQKYPTCVWAACTEIKLFYRLREGLGSDPQLLIFTPSQFPEWDVKLKGHKLKLRNEALYDELFGGGNSFSSDPLLPFREQHNLYRLDLKALDFKVKELLENSSYCLSLPDMKKGDIELMLPELSSSQTKSFFHKLLNKNSDNSLRTLLLPFVSYDFFASLDIKISRSAEGADLHSLVKRLEFEDLPSSALGPYLQPTDVPGLVSFYIPESLKWNYEDISRLSIHRLILMLRRLALRPLSNDTVLVIAEKACKTFLESLVSSSDRLTLLSSSDISLNPSVRMKNERIKSLAAPGFPMLEYCLPSEIKNS